MYAAIEDAGPLRDALGVALPLGVPAALTEPVPDPLRRRDGAVRADAAPFPASAVAAAWYGLGVAVVATALRLLAAEGRMAEGEFLPAAGHRMVRQ